MGKYSKDLDSSLVELVEQEVAKTNLQQIGVRVEPIKLNKSNGSVGEILKGNELVKLFINGDDLVAIALYEDAFFMVDEETRRIWVESLVSQISYDIDKDKLVITKPELMVPLGMYRKYGSKVVDKMEIALMTVTDLEEKRKEEKKKNK